MAEKNTAELQYLNDYYKKPGSQLIILYGQKHIGMQELLGSFCAGKPAFFYQARACSEREQRYLWGEEIREKGGELSAYPDFPDLFYAAMAGKTGKRVLVITEFQNIVRQSRTFAAELLRFIRSSQESWPVMAVLCSNSIGWVENSMVRKIGQAAYGISGFLKIKEQGSFELHEYFKKNTIKEQIELYAVLGGFPKLWEHFKDGVSLRENICANLLQKGSFLHEEALVLVTEQLREINVYATILASLAAGRQKLNDLHLHTEFSRAKISVYLKNLMELELVEKVFSYDTAGRANVQKGIYRIRHSFVRFYFRYLYPRMSRLADMEPGDFYDAYIADDIAAFTAPMFGQACREYIERKNRSGALSFRYNKIGEWIGKTGTIDVVAQDEEGHTLIGLACLEKPLSYKEYEKLMFCAQKAKLLADEVYLFSEGFEEKLLAKSREDTTLRLVSLKDFWG